MILMKEKFYEDLGLDDGINILDKFKIDIDEIVENKEVKDNKDDDKK